MKTEKTIFNRVSPISSTFAEERQASACGDKGHVFSKDVIPGTEILEEHWITILNEFKELSPSLLEPWPETNLYNGTWKVFGLHAFGSLITRNCHMCPETTRFLERIPNVVTAGYSILGARSQIIPHVGYTSSVLRVHLGLIVPPGCSISVGEETREWEEGKCMVFDDTAIHSARNNSDQDRIVFLLDVQKPGMTFVPTHSQEVEEARARLMKEEMERTN